MASQLLTAPLLLLALLCAHADAHGWMTQPPSRIGGTTSNLSVLLGPQFWFSNMVYITSEPTLPEHARSVNRNVTDGKEDVFRYHPWRSPGSAPVFGTGCGTAGGGPTVYQNGGNPPPGYPMGFDMFELPATVPTVWRRGATVEVGFALEANHGGGYQYRLCSTDGEVTEECFQKHPLDFKGENSRILWANGTSYPFPRVSTNQGTNPASSQWARNPIPVCHLCDFYETCGPEVTPKVCSNFTVGDCPDGSIRPTCGECHHGELPPGCPGLMHRCHDEVHPGSFAEQQVCYANCAGSFDGGFRPDLGAKPHPLGCPEGTAQFPPPAALSGFNDGGVHDWDWSVMDDVEVPSELPVGDYVLSWRWDGEQSAQVWQNCADVRIV